MSRRIAATIIVGALSLANEAFCEQVCYRAIGGEQTECDLCFPGVASPLAPPGITLCDGGAGCSFLFWWIDGEIHTERLPTDIGSFGRADAFYACGEGDGPPRLYTVAFDLSCGQRIEDDVNLHIESTVHDSFASDCTKTPCDLPKQTPEFTLTSVIAKSSLSLNGVDPLGCSLPFHLLNKEERVFSRWFVDGAFFFSETAPIGDPSSSSIAIAFYVQPAPIFRNPGGPGPQVVDKLCWLILPGVDDCPGCSFDNLCVFRFEDAAGLDIEFFAARDGRTIARAKKISSGVKEIVLDPQTIKNIGGIGNIGARFYQKNAGSNGCGYSRMIMRERPLHGSK